MRRVLCGYSRTGRPATKAERKKVSENILTAIELPGMPDRLRVFDCADTGGDHYFIYWDFELMGEVINSGTAFYYKGRYFIGKEQYRYPQSITFKGEELGELIVVTRGDIMLMYRNGEHIGNFAFARDIYAYLRRAWETKTFSWNKWQGFEYDESKIDHALAMTLFMTICY